MKTPLVAANWKMHKTVRETLSYAHAIRDRMTTVNNVEVVVAPPFTALHTLAGVFAGSAIGVAGQNLHSEPHGAFTGEISANMLKEAGAGYVIIGHSERRHLFGETNETTNAKLHAAIKAELVPILCVGETLTERESNETFTVIGQQLESGLADISPSQATALVVAYEPVWAIGTGHNATPEQAQEVHAQIRKRLAQILNENLATGCRILYGGSVKPNNVNTLSTQLDVDGALVGGASLDAESFLEIVAKSRSTAV